MLVAYDMVGNPWSYRGHTLEWSRIRLLTKWDDIEIDYNASGIRTRKGDTYYELDGSTIISETTCGDTIRYYYGNGGIVGFRYNGNRYYYEKNLMGDITGIYDESGSKVAGYIYDAWGNCTITTDTEGVASANPFRYRSYYYDSDLGLYYLKSRYYDAVTGRFINADSVNYLGANGDLAAYNLFAYCNNTPTCMMDETGTVPFLLVTAIVGAIIGAVAGGIIAAENDQNVWAGIGIGAAAGALIGTGIGAVSGAALAGSITASTTAVAAGGSTLVNTIATGGIGAGTTYVASNMQHAGEQIANTANSVFHKTPSNPGVPFEPNKVGFQYGVDPNTLTPTKNLSTLDPHRLSDAVKYGGNHAIQVGKSGIIQDGHHRVADAIANGRAIDVYVEPYY